MYPFKCQPPPESWFLPITKGFAVVYWAAAVVTVLPGTPSTYIVNPPFARITVTVYHTPVEKEPETLDAGISEPLPLDDIV